MNGTTYGYIRVSSKDQNEDRQRIAMHDAGVDERHIFMDKQSGKDFERPGYKRVLRKLRQHRIIRVRGSRSQNFRQMAQNSAGHADAWSRNFGPYDEQLCKRDVCIELCGVALMLITHKVAVFDGDIPLDGICLIPRN